MQDLPDPSWHGGPDEPKADPHAQVQARLDHNARLRRAKRRRVCATCFHRPAKSMGTCYHPSQLTQKQDSDTCEHYRREK